ncbi:MAG: hypothetical protein JWM50_1592 [Microbacteriaceae bacterium]|nr:hypothetical protein [Microbacteriaceae bacterium]
MTTRKASQRLAVVVFVVMLLVVVSVVPWRRGIIYSGGADAVVVGKAVIAILGLGAAVLVHSTARVRGTTGGRSLTLLATIIIVSALGALSTGDADAALVLVVRLIIASATVVLIVRTAPPLVVLSALLAAMGVVSAFTSITGLTSGLTEGRLAGGLPEMAPNVLAGLAGPPILGLAWSMVSNGIKLWNWPPFVVLLVIVVATGSRTSLLVGALGLLLVLLHAKRLPTSTTIASIIAVPVLVALFALTDTIREALARGQNVDEIATLSSRTVAWEAVLNTPLDTWSKWIGVGLAAKTVGVQERFRDVQVLDSSWVSIIAQAGIIGTVLLAVWVLFTCIDSVRNRSLRPITSPLLVLILIRSFTENGLIESSATFVLFLAIALTLEGRSRYPGHAIPPDRYLLAQPLPHTSASTTKGASTSAQN